MGGWGGSRVRDPSQILGCKSDMACVGMHATGEGMASMPQPVLNGVISNRHGSVVRHFGAHALSRAEISAMHPVVARGRVTSLSAHSVVATCLVQMGTRPSAQTSVLSWRGLGRGVELAARITQRSTGHCGTVRRRTRQDEIHRSPYIQRTRTLTHTAEAEEGGGQDQERRVPSF